MELSADSLPDCWVGTGSPDVKPSRRIQFVVRPKDEGLRPVISNF